MCNGTPVTKEGNSAICSNIDEPGGHYEIHQAQKDKFCMIPLLQGCLKTTEFIEAENRMVVAGG